MTPPAVTFPVTDKLVNVPTEVMFGCAAVVNVPPNVVALTSFVALTLFALALPVTANDDKVPTLVMFGCEAVVNEPATVVKLPPVA